MLGGRRTKEAKSHNLQSTDAHFITTWRSPRRTKWDHSREDLMWSFAADACQHWISGRIWSLSQQIKNVFDLSEFLLGTNSPFLSSTMTCRDTQDKVCWGSDARIVFSVCQSGLPVCQLPFFFSLVHQISISIQKKCLLVLWNPDTVDVATPRHYPSPQRGVPSLRGHCFTCRGAARASVCCSKTSLINPDCWSPTSA